MASVDEAPSWADQWGAGGVMWDENDSKQETNDKGKKKTMDNVKAAASTGLGKVKAAATVGAQKVKSGTGIGIKWVKNQYQKRSSK